MHNLVLSMNSQIILGDTDSVAQPIAINKQQMIHRGSDSVAQLSAINLQENDTRIH